MCLARTRVVVVDRELTVVVVRSSDSGADPTFSAIAAKLPIQFVITDKIKLAILTRCYHVVDDYQLNLAHLA